MKKTIRFFAIAAAFAAMAACHKEQDIVEVPVIIEENAPEAASYDPAEYLTGFGAAMEETKADLAESGAFSWTTGDQVKVIRSDGQEALYAYNESESKFAPVGEPLEKNGEPMHAFFPAGNFVWDTDHVQFTMPAAFESLTGIMNPMAAVVPADATAETSITLLNLGAIYEIRMTRAQTKGETVTKIELGNTGVKITGSATVSFDSAGTPSIGGLDGAKSVSLAFASPVTLTDTPKSVYFFLPVTGTDEFAGMYVKLFYGKTVDAATYEPFEQKTRNSAMTVTRSMRKHMNFAANGFFSGGDGSETNPYLISTANDFKAIKGKMESTEASDGYVSETGTFFGSTGVHYQQTGTIDFASSDITENMIGTSSVPFKGTYDGNGNELKAVSISASSANAGVFGYVDGGTIRKLSVSGTVSSSANYVGAIAGRMNSGIISGCSSSATVGGANAVGGLVGYMATGTIGSSDGTPDNTEKGVAYAANGCANTGDVTGNQHVGGIVGQMVNGLLSICRNAGNVTATGAYNAGGIVGYMQGGTMRLCYSKNGITIQAPQQAGGLAGYLSSASSIVVMNCSSKSNVTSTNCSTDYHGAVGGLVGRMYSNTNNCVVANSVAWASDVMNTNNNDAYAGGIVGWITGQSKKSIVRNCYSQHNGAAGSSNCRVGIKIGDAVLTFGTNCGGVFGYLENGEVDDCYWTKHNLVQSAGKETGTAGNKSVTNVQSMSNDAKNGTAQFATSVNYKNGRGKGTQYLYEHLRLGSFSTSSGSTLFSYTGFTTESSCAWGQKETFGAALNGKNAIPVAIGYLPMGTNGWWLQ